ncbi:MAG: family 16 glycosylhydrolase [Muribaculaceae bacterium]|nr:family 16 glycosylhydrolase [Muribaculaceae bacterium]
MNKFIWTLLFAFVPFVLCSCSDKKDEPQKPGTTVSDVNIKVTPEAISTGYESAEVSLTVTANADWSIKPDADWCTATPSGGAKNQETVVKVKINGNDSGAKRTANLVIKSGSKTVRVPVSQTARPTLNVSATTISFGAQASSTKLTIQTSDDWSAIASASWCTLTPTSANAGNTEVQVNAEANPNRDTREATITIKSGELTQKVKVQQYSDVIEAPDGYTLVWHDEFNAPNGSMPDTQLWYYDIWPKGYVNNELQRYVAGREGNEYTAIIEDGILNIIARKYGSEVISARINTRELWQYGYFEARLKLPKGKGTWPAFWMMPANGNNWPHCGEIDIMEEVGVNPNYTSSSIHCTAYNHTIGTQKTAERYTPGAEEEFHVYALEWTPEYIRTYVDGQPLLYFANDGKGDENTWPFNKPFHPILNLAWGGDWGGWNGVDPNALPATYQIDYVRVFQKK